MNLYTIFLLVIILIFSFLLSFEDVKSRKISNLLLFIGPFLVIIVHSVFNFRGLMEYLVSALTFGLFYFLIWLKTGHKLGKGDIFFGIFQGLCLHFKMIFFCVILEVVFAVLYLILKSVLKKSKHFKVQNFESEKLPFIPFMSLGLVVSFLSQIAFNFF